MNIQPTLENDLVRIRPLDEDDFEQLFTAAADPAIWEQHWTTDRWLPAGFKKFFDESIASGGCMVIIEKSTGKIIGSSRYNRVENIDHAIEIGWSFLSKSYWGGPYNRSFKSLMINHALTSVKDVLFLIAHDNIRSQKATEKLGGQRLISKNHPAYCRKPNTHHTYCINAIL